VNPLRFAVIGVGRMGANHARVLSELPGVSLVAVCDADLQLAERVGRRCFADHVRNDVGELLALDNIDAVVVAVPTVEHLPVALQCLSAGVAVLIEKPMATDEAECNRLIQEASRKGCPLMVGHVERFNPAIAKLKEFLGQRFLGEVYYVETSRSGPFPRRLYGSKDGVVIDLAVHDLDLIAHLFGGLKQLYANHIVTPGTLQDIHARILFKTPGGIVGSSQFSWISPRRERSITVYGDTGILACNLIDQEIWYYENGDVGIDYSDNYFQNVMMGRVSEGKVVKYPVKKEEPLRSELAFFAELVRGKQPHDPAYGREAVRYSQSVLESARQDRIIRFDQEGTHGA
jgi:UDP-N-acetylglucosamine 3-dehydrogenase